MLKKLVLISIIIIIFQNIVFSQTKNFEVKSSTALAFTPSVEDITTTSISPILIFNYKLGKDYVIGAKLGASFVILNRKDYTTQNSFDIGNIILKGGLINAIDYYNIKTDATLNFGVPLAPFPGNILPVRLSDAGGCLICQKDSFLCAAKGVSIGIHFQKKIGVALFGGEEHLRAF